MAGRGRGRGRTTFTFNVDSLGFGRGDALPNSSQTPSPLYPPMQFRPVPLQTGEEVDYMLALKQELRASSKNLPFHIQTPTAKKDVVRYSDKYQNGVTKHPQWIPDWSQFPKELSIRIQKPRKAEKKAAVKSNSRPAASKELLHKLEILEQNEVKTQSDEEGNEDEEEKKKIKKAEEEEEEPEDAEEYNEEEFEEETDYIMSYFDNGEDFGGDSDDNIDEATY